MGACRGRTGWQTEEARQILGIWQEAARRRVELCERLSLKEVYDDREFVRDDLDDRFDRVWEAMAFGETGSD